MSFILIQYFFYTSQKSVNLRFYLQLKFTYFFGFEFERMTKNNLSEIPFKFL